MPNLNRPFAGLEKVDFTGLRMRLINADNQVGQQHQRLAGAAHCSAQHIAVSSTVMALGGIWDSRPFNKCQHCTARLSALAVRVAYK